MGGPHRPVRTLHAPGRDPIRPVGRSLNAIGKVGLRTKTELEVATHPLGITGDRFRRTRLNGVSS